MIQMNLRAYLGAGVRLATVLLSAGCCLQAQSIGCAQALSPGQQRTLLDYVRKRYKLADSIALEIFKQGLVKDTCYRELTFRGTSQIRTWDLTLYLAPDLRFLSSDILDTSVDPEAEQRAKDVALLNGLTQGPPVRGSDKSPVTIAVFSDFQCPYCRRFAQCLDEVLADGTKDMRVVSTTCPSVDTPGRVRLPRAPAARNCRALPRSGRCTTRFSAIRRALLPPISRTSWASLRSPSRGWTQRRSKSVWTAACRSDWFCRTSTSPRPPTLTERRRCLSTATVRQASGVWRNYGT